jgi:outer membrane protein OmpA-like peptidoglycan-associated protein
VILSKGIFVVQVAESETALSVTDQKFGDLASRYLIKSIPSENGYSYIIDEQQDFMWAYASYREAVAAGFGDAMIKTFLPADTAETELWNFRKSYGTSSELFFVNNGTVVSQKGMPVLDRLILLMKRNPRLRIMVAAHTDNTGTSYTNQQLSLRQAQSIVDYLVLNGISRSRLSANGYGGLRPVYPDFPESERLKNRRIEFVKVN